MSDGPISGRPGDGENDPAAALNELLQRLMRGEDLQGLLPPGLAQMPGMPTDAASLQQMMMQVQSMMSGSGDGPVNWKLAHDVARQTGAEGGDPVPGDADQRRVAEALRTADLWLERVCDLPAATARTEAWSRAEWIEKTFETWQKVVEPVAESVGNAITKAMTEQAPEELRGMLGGAMPMMRSMGGAFFGAQLGQALGALSREVIGGGDIGLPLLPAGRAALLPANVAAFGEGLDLPEDEVRLYLAAREAAHARLVNGVPWLRAHLLGAVEEYAHGITIDTEGIERAVREIDPTDPEALQRALGDGLFEPERTPAQQAALDRLETALALVEGWVDTVVDAATRDSLPHAAALRETVGRRRAVGGPAEHTFATLVGLELRPRRLREAAQVWSELTRQRGVEGRDALWAHPDLVPTAEALGDPAGFAAPVAVAAEADLDSEFAAAMEQWAAEGDSSTAPKEDSTDGPAEGEAPPAPKE